ncbi:MAG: hypothetical protein UX72_C0005G0059 [Parcubacteria group bacterium GW2011_GWA2_47_10]|nr:MAG: hypothetical protein UX72_C0005G0059 [Parcubacteria group bacterium GW2011_GWA2_47_10]
MFKNISSKNRFLGVAVSIALGVALVVYLLLSYVFPYILSEVDAIQAMKTGIATLEVRRAKLKDLEGSFQESHQDLERLRGLLVDRSNPIAFFESLYSIASSSQISLTIRFSAIGVPAEKMKENKPQFGVSVHLAAEGSSKNIYVFLSLLEALPYELKVEKLSLFDTSGATLRAEMDVSALSIN